MTGARWRHKVTPDPFSLKTPFYLFDFDAAAERVRLIQSLLPKNARLCYAIKANAFLLRALKDMDGLLFEVCSEGELEICRKLNVAPGRIVFSGVMKNREMLRKAVDYGVKIITIESLSHLDDLIAVLPQGKTQEIILRLSSGNQFGMGREDLVAAAKTAAKNPRLSLRGIHYFSGTQKKLSKIKEEIAFIEEFCRGLKAECGADISCIEYGPGLRFDYFSKDDFSLNTDDLAGFSEAVSESAFSYTVELGRFIASPCGTYITKICDIKKTDGQNYIIIDGGINHINYYGQIMAMKEPPCNLIKKTGQDTEQSQDYCVCGSLCTTADVIVRKMRLASPAQGDLLAFNNIGAYSVTEGIYLFLSHALPSVYSVQNGTLRTLREMQETYPLNS